MKKLPVYELTFDDKEFDSIYAISIVDMPAIEKDFMMFSKNEPMKFQEINEEKRIITGPALIPNKKIYRRDNSKGEFEVFFSEDTIRKVVIEYLKSHHQEDVTLEHQIKANNIHLFESWIIEDETNDKATALGFDLPKGTWMVSMKVDNDAVWNEIKLGYANGFSIEGYLTQELTKLAATQELSDVEVEAKINEILNQEKPNEVIYDDLEEFLKQFD